MLRGARSSLNVVKHHALSAPALSRLLSIAPASGQASPAAATDLPPQATSNASSSRHVPAKRHSRPRYNTTCTDADGEQPKRLLQPHVLSQRLTRMCTDGRLDEALEYLKTLPLDSQNTAVWNTLISQAGSQRRTKLAYQIYIEMKRRGFKPNLITFATLMGAFAKISSWEKHTKLYESVHKTYQAFLDFIDAVKEHNPQSPQIAVAPVDAYIRVLARAADYQRAFDVWNALDEDGPLSPGIRTYSAMLFVCCLRGQTASGETAQSVRERAASDARLIWRQLVKRMERDESLVPDVILIDIMIRCLALGRPADHIVAFDILRDYVGLAKPGETAPPAQVELSPILLQDVLFLCQMAQKPRLCVHFVQQLMETQPTILDNGHMEQVLTAYGTLGAMGAITDASRALQTVEWMIEREVVHGEGTRIRPGLATFTLVLNAS
ncbi:hypothetical protein BN946_scf184470.g8 [Trametes cinnabarina]|uniref:Pentacotripeptide-repeat region of PRORP domain-containing protein n=1 Tax=Pycnoporus cinnabarinus TaxID=5643 RepID=A0A060SPF0_PYCCI|nr:hypothetical protein BN946_scf184470.g8 [Trametes cinnabarina]